MSEYQYYEFQAIDRPLTKREMTELRALSTRAEISPRRFVNVYNYGDFGGDPRTLMEKYFDAFVYVTNWGTNECMFRLPRPLLDHDLARRYLPDDDVAGLHTTADHLILDLTTHDDDMMTWEEDSERWLPSLLPLREELAGGDLRGLYVGWLLCAQLGAIDDEVREPPVPPGLSQPSEALAALVEFLHIDADLLAIAAEGSTPLQRQEPSVASMRRWLGTLSADHKDDVLLRLMEGDDRTLRAELTRRFRHAQAPPTSLSADEATGRSVEELIAAAEARTEERQRAEVERKAAARAVFLQDLAGREEQVWGQVELHIEEKHRSAYDQAVKLTIDLRDANEWRHTAPAFEERLRRLRARHATKSSLRRLLDEAGLPGG